VTGGAPTIELGTETLGGVIDSRTMLELPLNGRDWTQLATLQPGVISLESMQQPVSNSNQRGFRGYGIQMSISGSRPQQNNYLIDGVSANDYTNGGPGSVQGLALGVDAIQEFTVLTSNYSAEYGRSSGGVISAITRSGTNTFHGDAYEFVRDSALDARNYFDTGAVPPFNWNQFGGSAGGPIRKDKTFIFGDYEGFRETVGVSHLATVPSPDARNGIIHNSDGSTTNITVDPKVTPFLALWRTPNGAILPPGNTGIYSFSGDEGTSEDFATVRLDQKFSENDSLSGSYQYDRASNTAPDSLNDVLIGSNTGRQIFTAQETHIFNQAFLNSARFGFVRHTAINASNISAINPAAADAALLAVPGEFAPQITVPGITPFTGGVNAGTSAVFHYNSFQLYDDALVTKGIHSIKFGVYVERIQNELSERLTVGGSFRFGTLTTFLTNAPTSFSAGFPEENTPRNLRQTIFGTYVQDDVRWKPNLTVNLGLRYEMSTVPTETQGKLAALRNVTDPMPHLGDPLFSNPTLHNFEPRVGFAWDPFRDGKTSVRAAFGIYDVLPLPYQYANVEVTSAPFSLSGTAQPLPQGSFAQGAFPLLSPASHLRTSFVQPNPQRSYVMQWNTSVQRELARDLTATVAYVGSHSLHQLFRADDANMVLPTLTPFGYLWPSPVGSGTLLNPVIGRMDYLDWGSSGSYDALQASLMKRLGHGLQAQASYTWGKCIDEGSESGQPDPFLNSITSLLFFDARSRRGLCDYNNSQNLVINYTWNIPSPHSLEGVASWATSGWQIGGIYQVRTGLPFTPILGGDVLGQNSQDPFDFPDRITGPGCKSAIHPGNVTDYINLSCFTFPTAPTQAFYTANCDPRFPFPSCANLRGNAGRNSLIGPGLSNFDFSLIKNNLIRRVSETFTVQVRAEFFNLFNHPNFLPPIDNSALFDQTGAPIGGAGLIDGTSTNNRQIQFGVKLLW
jgi:hypothetical protein